jgi:tetratricopeptide (TPR) repeat protein
MSLWGRFLGNRRNRACAEGVALLENGQYSEAVALLREASLGSSEHPTGSLASFHFRQALVAEGRQHLRAGDHAGAISCFAEAVKLWDPYPDLHCLHGAAQGLSGNWEAALVGARAALRRNADYAEARLLETVALQKQDRLVEAADSLNALVESGRRVEHWLINGLEGRTQFEANDLPSDLEALLVSSLSGQSEKEEVAAAVAQCRAGQWQEGLERFGDLVKKRPRYPDYRTRHAAALFHLGRNEEALAEVEAALALNETYRTAINLKGLVLADEGRLREAREFLAAADITAAEGNTAGAHEELFGAYLRGVLALLGGEPGRVFELLEGWSDLARNFARAELLQAAAEDLLERNSECSRRLSRLAEEWTAEPIYFFLLACHHLGFRRFEQAAGVLGRWPAGSPDPDRRPLFLEANLALDQGRVPDLPDPDPADATLPGAVGSPNLGPRAWIFLSARAEILQENHDRAWGICEDLITEGFATEKLVKLQVVAASRAKTAVPEGWQPPPVLPDSCLPGLVHYGVGRDDGVRPKAVLEKYNEIHPEQIRATWLSPAFWLDPVRNWIA